MKDGKEVEWSEVGELGASVKLRKSDLEDRWLFRMLMLGVGILLILSGLTWSIMIIGAIIGIPMMAFGGIIIYLLVPKRAKFSCRKCGTGCEARSFDKSVKCPGCRTPIHVNWTEE